MPAQSTLSQASFFLKWPLLGSDFICAISLSHSARTGV